MQQFRVGPWLVDTERNIVVRDGNETLLEPRTMEVLAYLVTNANRVVTSEELLDTFWAGLVVEESTIHRRISMVRQVLGDNTTKPIYVRTVRKKGYQFIATAEVVSTAPRLHNSQDAEKRKKSGAIRDAILEARLLCETPTVERVKAAASCYRNALELDPHLLHAHTGMAIASNLLSQMGERNWQHHREARESLATAFEIDSEEPEVEFTAGLMAHFEEHDDDALTYFASVLQKLPEHAGARLYRAHCQFAIGSFRDAESELKMLLQAEPLSPECNMLMADVLAAIGDPLEAQGYLERATKLGADHPAVLCRAGRFYLWVLGDIEKGISYYRDAWLIDPDDTRTVTALMSSMLLLGEENSMRKWAELARSRHPHNQALAFWRLPGVTAPFDERRRYIDAWRKRETSNRDWLRVAAELELELVRTGSEAISDTLRTTSLKRAYAMLVDYLQQGGELSLDQNDIPCSLRPRYMSTYALWLYMLTAEQLGHANVSHSIITSLISYFGNLSDGPHTVLAHVCLCVGNARLGNLDVAIKHLELIEPCGYIAMGVFNLIGVSNDTSGKYHDIHKTPSFLTLAKRAQARVERARNHLRQNMPDMFSELKAK